MIIPDPNFVPINPVSCTSSSVTENDNLLYGADNTHDLPCDLDNDGNVVIYGLAQDVILIDDYAKVKIMVSSFTYPGYASDISTWNGFQVKIKRWGTNNLLLHYNTAKGPSLVSPGSITVAS